MREPPLRPLPRELGDLALVGDRPAMPPPLWTDGDRRRRPPRSRLPHPLNLLEDLECWGEDMEGDKDVLLADDDLPLLMDKEVDFPSDDERRDFSRRRSEMYKQRLRLMITTRRDTVRGNFENSLNSAIGCPVSKLFWLRFDIIQR